MAAAFDIGLTLVADEVNLLPVGVDGTRFYTENGERGRAPFISGYVKLVLWKLRSKAQSTHASSILGSLALPAVVVVVHIEPTHHGIIGWKLHTACSVSLASSGGRVGHSSAAWFTPTKCSILVDSCQR
jgi:hypothetical protein